MNKMLLLLLFSLSFLLLSATEEKGEEEAFLDSLVDLINQTLYTDLEKGRYYMKELEQEAKRFNNIQKESYVKAKWVELYYSQFDTDSIFMAAEEAEIFARTHKQYKYLFTVSQIVIQRYSDQRNYSLAIKKTPHNYELLILAVWQKNQ